MDNNDKLYECAESYAGLTDYEYKLILYNNGTIIDTTVNLDVSSFMHLSGLEKLNDLPLIERNPNSRIIHEMIKDKSLTYEYICNSEIWSTPLNDPQTNNVTYSLDDRIETLTNFRDLLNNHLVKAYSWNPDCHSSQRPYNSEIKADFILIFEPENKKTSDERVYAFFKFDKNNPKIAHGVSQFPTDRTYNNDGRISVPEITVMSLIEHDKVNNVDRVIFELSPEERQRLLEKSLKNSEYATIKLDLKQLKGKRTKYLEANTEASKKAYEKRLSIFSNRNIYTDEMLISVVDRLTSQAQDPNNKQAQNLILKEVELIKAELTSREKNAELPSGIQIAKFVQHNDGTISVTEPIATVKTPQFVDKAESAIKRAAHFVAISAADIVSNIKDKFKNAFLKSSEKASEKKQPIKKQPVKPKSKSVQSVKPTPHVQMPVKKQTHEEEKVPMFSISELQSDKYAPTSSKDKNISRTKKNDLDL